MGLGQLILKDRERAQPSAGRLDLLLQDVAGDQRFEVEVQLGRTDESHIIRTIEYWDLERRRYPQYDHTAVIVAEDITSRFLNVVSLFNGFIPLVAIKMQALQVDDNVMLVFTTVLDRTTLGSEEEDDGMTEPADRLYWEQRANKATVAVADDILAIINGWDPNLTLKYNKEYIGIAKDGQPRNFVILNPKKGWMRVQIRLERAEETQARLDEAGLDLMDYSRSGRYRIRMTKDDVGRHKELLAQLLKAADEQYG